MADDESLKSFVSSHKLYLRKTCLRSSVRRSLFLLQHPGKRLAAAAAYNATVSTRTSGRWCDLHAMEAFMRKRWKRKATCHFVQRLTRPAATRRTQMILASHMGALPLL